jgi:hypothetical protein
MTQSLDKTKWQWYKGYWKDGKFNDALGGEVWD